MSLSRMKSGHETKYDDRKNIIFSQLYCFLFGFFKWAIFGALTLWPPQSWLNVGEDEVDPTSRLPVTMCSLLVVVWLTRS